jgi:uncharacterized membrane protein
MKSNRSCNTGRVGGEVPDVSHEVHVIKEKAAMKRRTLNLAIAGSFASALAMLAVPASAQDTEKCYGVAMKGQNDCKSGMHDCKGHSTMDYDGESFKMVPAGTCTTMQTPNGMGSLEPKKS